MSQRTLNVQVLSNEMLFAEFQHCTWAEQAENLEHILPDVSLFDTQEAQTFIPDLHSDVDEATLHQKLTAYFEEVYTYFLPSEQAHFVLKSLTIDPEHAQAILFKAKNPCRIMAIKGDHVLIMPGDEWVVHDLAIGAFLLLGYLPPLIPQQPIVGGWSVNPKKHCEQVIHNHIDALMYEFRRLSEVLF